LPVPTLKWIDGDWDFAVIPDCGRERQLPTRADDLRAVVEATVSWHTGKAVGGKSAKFELTFNTVNVRDHEYALTGKHRQEGKGNTVAALLGSMVISGHSPS
jgi:hypothetical protein